MNIFEKVLKPYRKKLLLLNLKKNQEIEEWLLDYDKELKQNENNSEILLQYIDFMKQRAKILISTYSISKRKTKENSSKFPQKVPIVENPTPIQEKKENPSKKKLAEKKSETLKKKVKNKKIEKLAQKKK